MWITLHFHLLKRSRHKQGTRPVTKFEEKMLDQKAVMSLITNQDLYTLRIIRPSLRHISKWGESKSITLVLNVLMEALHLWSLLQRQMYQNITSILQTKKFSIKAFEKYREPHCCNTIAFRIRCELNTGKRWPTFSNDCCRLKLAVDFKNQSRNTWKS